VGNFAPDVTRTLFEAASAQDRTRLDELLRRVILPICNLRAARRGFEVSVVKTVMRELGLAAGPVRPPLIEPGPEEMEVIRRCVHANASAFLRGDERSVTVG
jgi:5-dehydro-4-deoxyglucarate dehydratase